MVEIFTVYECNSKIAKEEISPGFLSAILRYLIRVKTINFKMVFVRSNDLFLYNLRFVSWMVWIFRRSSFEMGLFVRWVLDIINCHRTFAVYRRLVDIVHCHLYFQVSCRESSSMKSIQFSSFRFISFSLSFLPWIIRKTASFVQWSVKKKFFNKINKHNNLNQHTFLRNKLVNYTN